ncbi:MAG: cytochrome-c oxidase, cbb3-type subunit II, partial [Bacteroidetes bacterium]
NGLMTLRGAWDKVRDEPVLKYFVVALTCYGMSTFEGPMLSLKSVNAISHFTDWTIAHVHVGSLGWNGFLTFGMLYWLIPRIFQTPLYSKKWATNHFWIGTLGIILYAVPMYWAGFSQALMWKEFTEEGTLKYQFLQTVTSIVPLYALRSFGGLLYFIGVILMVVNIWKTVAKGSLLANEAAEAPALSKVYVVTGKEGWHSWIERRPIQLLVGSLIVVAVGGLVELIPTFLIKSNIPTIASVKPYTPLELEGRDLYIREGCYTCHSQMIRPFRDEVARYGEYSKAGEFVYDHPFQWGSKRTGPDLARIGGKYPDSWHYTHMDNPQLLSPGTIMPRYSWLLDQEIDTAMIPAKIRAMQTLGVPYKKGFDKEAVQALSAQAKTIADGLKRDNINTPANKEIIALIAYLQRMGKDIKGEPAVVAQ